MKKLKQTLTLLTEVSKIFNTMKKNIILTNIIILKLCITVVASEEYATEKPLLMINDTTEELDKKINNDSIDLFIPVTEVYDTDEASTGAEPLFLALAEEGSPVGVTDTEGDSKRQEEYSTTLAPHDVPDMMVGEYPES